VPWLFLLIWFKQFGKVRDEKLNEVQVRVMDIPSIAIKNGGELSMYRFDKIPSGKINKATSPCNTDRLKRGVDMAPRWARSR
jgi:hypothetical protein